MVDSEDQMRCDAMRCASLWCRQAVVTQEKGTRDEEQKRVRDRDREKGNGRVEEQEYCRQAESEGLC